MQEIDKDLIRWNRGQWMAVIGLLFAVQIAALVGGSKAVQLRAFYPGETRVGFSEPREGAHPGWADLENPFLFAAASLDGFSGEAWLRKPEWEPPAPVRPVAARFLGFAEARKVSEATPMEQRFALVERRRPQAVFSQPMETNQTNQQASALRLEGFEKRGLSAAMALPKQYHNDILTSSVVEALVGRDGLVISARLIENSGSPKADAEALALAKTARFAPAKNGSGETKGPEIGKLIFDWFALGLSETNNVQR